MIAMQLMLYAKDLARMVAFYRDAIGLVIAEQREGWVELDAGGSTFALHQIPPEHAAQIEIARPPRRRSETPYKATFLVPDIASAREKVLQLGGVAGEISAGATQCEVLDPEGNVIALRHPGVITLKA